MARLMGFDLLRHQLLESIEEEFSEIDDWAAGDSEIERLFHAAIVLYMRHAQTEYDGAIICFTPELSQSNRANPENRLKLIVERQVQVGDHRVDFVISAWTWGRVWSMGSPPEDGQPRWRRLIVECDGHDYHERTKEQAARDRSRDRELNAAGFDVFRFTGSELWRDPWGCAQQVYNWAVRGFDYNPEYPS